MLTIAKIKKSRNVAELLTKEELSHIAKEAIRGYQIDEDSRTKWKADINEATDIAMQVLEEKDFPWEGASNIKYPLIAGAAIDYAARTGPEILRDDRLVKAKIIGNDPDGARYQSGENICEFMSWDLNYRSPDWVDGTDKLLQTLPILGTIFKKTYYNDLDKRICSDFCIPHNIVINYGAQSLDVARRVTHILTFYKDDVIARQRKGIFLEKDSEGNDIDASKLTDSVYIDGTKQVAPEDTDKPLDFLEQHCYLDLDEDGIGEPYIVTLHKGTEQVFRIKPRIKSIELNADKKVIQIIPIQYFTAFHFIRSFDGGFYSIGFGTLLLALNKAINSTFNMLLDSGTLSNTQGGVFGSSIRIKNGELKFKMGRWQQVSMAAGEELQKNIFPWPTKEPSQTLFSLLGLLIQVGKELTSSTDILSGKQPAQNVASNTVTQLIEQGIQTFKNINKRVIRSLTQEYQKIYELNAIYLSDKEYKAVLNNPDADKNKDFSQNISIYPVADPTISTEAQRMSKAIAIQQLRTVNPRAADEYFLETLQLDKSLIARLLPEQSKEPPAPDMIKAQAQAQESQATIANLSAQATLKAQELQMKMQKLQQDMKASDAQIQYYAALVWKLQQDAIHNMKKDQLTGIKIQSQESLKGETVQQRAQMNEHTRTMDAHKAAMDELKIAHEITTPPKPADIQGTKE